ncbi:EAL domain-containing protein [soil metagenome]
MSEKLRAPRGTFDVLPEDGRRRRELTEDGGHLRRTHEWRSEHAPARSDRDQFPVTAYPWATGQLKQEPVLYIPDPEELPPEAAAERASLEENHNRAALWVRLEGTQYSGLATLLWKQAPTSRIEALGLVRLAGETFVGAIGRRRAEALAVGQSDVLELVARGTPLGETLDAIAHLVEGHTTHVHGVISLVNEGEGSLRLTSAPTLPVPMRVFLDRWPVAPSSPIGLSAATGTPVQSIDLAGDDRFTGWAELADGHGFRAVACVPIVSSRTGRALGTLAVHGTSRRVVDDVDRKLSETAAALAAVAIERSQEESYLSYQATHDPLTGVSNRTALLDRLEHALARGRRTGQVVAVLFCDLDRFKIVNDRLGHDQGDALIVEVARRIDGVVRPTDTVARFGGDEFIVLCEDVGDEEGALMVADRIAHGIESQPVVLAGADVRVTVSIGIATSTDVADHPEALLRDADMAMYRATARGRARREVFRESIRRAAHDREHLADELADAVENGELRLHYQPMVALADGAVQGAEALLRWQHAERGLLLPPEFVPVADATGLIVPVGRWVIDEALRQLVAWRVEAPELDGLRMHINLSVRQLAEPGFVKGLLASLKGQKVAPSSVCLEITETILMDDAPATAKAIGTLTGAGVRLALDDFGTGYASLTYLRRFPVHYLKVDRTFVGGLGRGTEDTAIVRAVVNLAHALDLEAVAEGVETAEQLGLIRALGCDGGQGFFLARPRPGDEIPADLRTRLVGPALDVPVDVPVDGAPVDVAPVDVAESPSER